MHSDRTAIAQGLHRYRATIAQRSRNDCTAIAQRLDRYRTAIAQQSQSDSNEIMQHYHSDWIAPQLHSDCVAISKQ
jgi:hypothetical protein